MPTAGCYYCCCISAGCNFVLGYATELRPGIAAVAIDPLDYRSGVGVDSVKSGSGVDPRAAVSWPDASCEPPGSDNTADPCLGTSRVRAWGIDSSCLPSSSVRFPYPAAGLDAPGIPRTRPVDYVDASRCCSISDSFPKSICCRAGGRGSEGVLASTARGGGGGGDACNGYTYA